MRRATAAVLDRVDSRIFGHSESAWVLAWLLLVVFALPVAADNAAEAQLVIRNATLISSPQAAARSDAVLVIRDGRISAIQDAADPLPPARETIDVQGRLVTAGFWNSHVHFTQPHWEGAGVGDPESLARMLRKMLTAYGFTTVLDTGSDLANTETLAWRIERGHFAGPRILLSGGSFVPVGGSPGYLDVELPELATPEEAAREIDWVLSRDVRAIKIFSGSFVTIERTEIMPLAVVKSAAQTAHAKGALLIAHPQSLKGVQHAVRGGADLLMHTTTSGEAWPAELVAESVKAGVGLVPTLKLWRFEFTHANLPPIVIAQLEQLAIEQLSAFSAAGGDILFGTDVGYMTDYDTRSEYQLMGRAGLDFAQVLAALTVTPARRLGVEGETGTLTVGKRADLVVLAKDPREDLGLFADVSITVQAGEVIYREEQ
jgi:imidazolonepropionase-like amidohydrolase